MSVIWNVARLVAGAATSDASNRLLMLIASIAVGGWAYIFPGPREYLFGVASASLTGFAASLVVGLYANRNDNFVIVCRKDSMTVEQDGQLVRYEVNMKVRATTKNLRECCVRLGWSGDTDISSTKNWRSMQNGYSVRAERRRGFVDFVFVFAQPLRRNCRRTVSLILEMQEKDKVYCPAIMLDPRSYAWSVFARQVFTIRWDDTQFVDVDSICARTYRSGWERYRENTSAIQSWKSSDLEQVNGANNGRQWTLWPVRSDRWYILDFRLRSGGG